MKPLMETQEQESETVKIENPNFSEETLDNNEGASIKQKFLAECIGTMLLVFICCGVGVGVKTDFKMVPSVLGGSLSITGLIYLFQNVSGAHFNPVVSFPMYVLKKITLIELIYYIFAQFIGSMLGCLLLALCQKGKFDALSSTKVGEYLKNNGKIDDWGYTSAFFCEVILTFFLLMVILASTVKKNSFGNLTGLVVGITFIFLGFTGGNISGASLNPVRSFAPAFFEAVIDGNTDAIKQIWIYIFGPLIGSALSILAYFQIYN